MGACFIDGIEIGDDGRDAHGRDDLAAITPRRAASTDDAMADAQASCVHAARGLARVLRKNTCRMYLANPAYLNAIAWGLADAHPQIIRQRVEAKARTLSPHTADIVPVLPANLRGARLYALIRIRRDRAARRSILQAAE